MSCEAVVTKSLTTREDVTEKRYEQNVTIRTRKEKKESEQPEPGTDGKTEYCKKTNVCTAAKPKQPENEVKHSIRKMKPLNSTPQTAISNISCQSNNGTFTNIKTKITEVVKGAKKKLSKAIRRLTSGGHDQSFQIYFSLTTPTVLKMEMSCDDFRRSVQEEIDSLVKDFQELLKQADEYNLIDQLRPYIADFANAKEKMEALKADCLKGKCRHMNASIFIEKFERNHNRACNVVCIHMIECAKSVGLIQPGFSAYKE
ncbi:unnamed protein product [Caenorhabditis bovis]|uniref:Uncharacterized protein n=1 Tax=Caenorhabditis bovis TaxID=2654633 RepID=A0A8S1FC37_9PELO|nr:unnamed protein product [Caenorhabditis bovis]